MLYRTALCLLTIGLLFTCVSMAMAEEDQQPILVQIKAEIYHSTRDAIKAGEKTLGIEGKSQALVPVRIKTLDIDSIRTVIGDFQQTDLSFSPMFSGKGIPSGQMITSCRTLTSSTRSEPQVNLVVVPIVGPDNSVKFSFIVTLSGPDIKDYIGLAASMNLAEGDSVLCYDIDDATGKALLVIITPTIVKNEIAEVS